MRRIILWIPIVYSFLYSYVNYLYVKSIASDLSFEAQILFHEEEGQLFFYGLLILFPNLLLSILLWMYSKYRSDLNASLLVPCLIPIIFGTLLTSTFYSAHNQLESTQGMDHLLIPYGFPFTYFFGLAFGWVFSVVIMATFYPKRKG